MSTIIGIDPGITGALAVMENDCMIEVEDMPIVALAHGKKTKRQVSPQLLTDLLENLTHGRGEVLAIIEAVHSMPDQGVASSFNFGKGCGRIEGVLAGMRIPYTFVTPQAWKKRAGLIGKDKDVARTLAIELLPDMSSYLARKKDIGRADAMLIAKFGGQV